jgi:serine/threonine-protein kinase RIO1
MFFEKDNIAYTKRNILFERNKVAYIDWSMFFERDNIAYTKWNILFERNKVAYIDWSTIFINFLISCSL